MRFCAAICLAFLGCSKPAARTHEVAIRGMQFVPPTLTVNVGDTVVWTNEDVLPHTVTSGIPSPTPFDSKEIASKARWQLTVTSPGEYEYTCTYHPTMKASLVAR